MIVSFLLSEIAGTNIDLSTYLSIYLYIYLSSYPIYEHVLKKPNKARRKFETMRITTNKRNEEPD